MTFVFFSLIREPLMLIWNQAKSGKRMCFPPSMWVRFANGLKYRAVPCDILERF